MPLPSRSPDRAPVGMRSTLCTACGLGSLLQLQSPWEQQGHARHGPRRGRAVAGHSEVWAGSGPGTGQAHPSPRQASEGRLPSSWTSLSIASHQTGGVIPCLPKAPATRLSPPLGGLPSPGPGCRWGLGGRVVRMRPRRAEAGMGRARRKGAFGEEGQKFRADLKHRAGWPGFGSPSSRPPHRAGTWGWSPGPQICFLMGRGSWAKCDHGPIHLLPV